MQHFVVSLTLHSARQSKFLQCRCTRKHTVPKSSITASDAVLLTTMLLLLLLRPPAPSVHSRVQLPVTFQLLVSVQVAV